MGERAGGGTDSRGGRCVTLLACMVVVVGAWGTTGAGAVEPRDRIAGGSIDNYTDTDFVSFVDFGDYLCTGSLISPRYVLTAAHCVAGERASQTTVRIGSKFRNRGGVVRRVSRFHSYPRYSNKGRWTHWGDMALLRLSRTTRVRPVRLVDKGYYPTYESVYIAGWGDLYFKGPSPRRLRSAWVWALKDRDCEPHYGRSYDSRVMMCGGVSPYRTTDTCEGDSGGPLAYPYRGRFYLLGVTSWGEDCAKGSPGVYAWVGSGFLRTWIRRVTGL